MNAKNVNDLFNKAWAELKDLETEVKIFFEENHLNPALVKIEMSGSNVHVKHNLPLILWTEDLHNRFCETFELHLTSFTRKGWKSQKKKPALITVTWLYAAEPHHEKFILPYKEVEGWTYE